MVPPSPAALEVVGIEMHMYFHGLCSISITGWLQFILGLYSYLLLLLNCWGLQELGQSPFNIRHFQEALLD